MLYYTKRLLALLYYIFYKYLYPDNKKAAYGYWFLVDGNKKHLLNHDLTSKSIVFEIGGYTGVFVEQLINKFDVEIYVFEPVNKFFTVLEDKFKSNPKIHLFNFGLSDTTKKVKISVLDDSSSTILDANGAEEEIMLVDIKEFMDDHKEINVVDLVNMNIEGGEYELIPRMIESGLMQKFKVLQIQFHNYFPEAPAKRLEIINKLAKTHDNYFSLPFIWDQFRVK